MRVDFPQSVCRAGFARADITPPVGMYHRTWGAALTDRSTGVHRPLLATAMSLETLDGTWRQIVLAIDHCLFWGVAMEQLHAAIAAHAEVELGELLIAFSHTHGAGLLGDDRTDLPGGELLPAYWVDMTHQLALAVRRAMAVMQPSHVVYGFGRCGLAAHRDFWDAETGQYLCGYNPDGPADDTLLVVRISDVADQTLGTVVNYACHPTTLAWQNSLISPDYVGALREVVEQRTRAPCMFLQGASGDLGPREGFVGETAVADRNGRRIGYAALEAIESLPRGGFSYQFAGPVTSGATIGTWRWVPMDAAELSGKAELQARRWTVDLPYRTDRPTPERTQAELEYWQRELAGAGNEARMRDCRAQMERRVRQLARLSVLPEGDAFPMPVAMWRLGDALWIAVESEHYQYLQQTLRSRFGVPIIVATLVNGSRPGYLPTREVYDTGIYQETVSLVAPGSLELLVDSITEQIHAWILAAG